MDVEKRANAGTFGVDRERALVPQVSDVSLHPPTFASNLFLNSFPHLCSFLSTQLSYIMKL
jgi:hypothetical protein